MTAIRHARRREHRPRRGQSRPRPPITAIPRPRTELGLDHDPRRADDDAARRSVAGCRDGSRPGAGPRSRVGRRGLALAVLVAPAVVGALVGIGLGVQALEGAMHDREPTGAAPTGVGIRPGSAAGNPGSTTGPGGP
jgi:hypothetical protein